MGTKDICHIYHHICHPLTPDKQRKGDRCDTFLKKKNNTNINGGYADGDLKREYTATGKFGTVCLPYFYVSASEVGKHN